MGIDIYMRWDGMTEEDRDKQITGFDPTKGDVGYLREASRGKIFATKYLVKEAFEKGADEVHIPAKELRKRLPLTKDIAIQREKEVYKEEITEDDAIVKAFEDFVRLAEALEEEGRKPKVYASY
tara:strand:+ start:963 stop:1334 length:372 start_codon:yes stop_codon:yes gene_type:complete